MNIGIIGSGSIGGALGRLWAQAGHEVFFSSRHPERLKGLVRSAGDRAQAGTTKEAIAFSDVLFEAVPFWAALELPADALENKTLLSAANYYPQRDGEIDLENLSQSEALVKRLPNTRIVKAFNMMSAAEMEALANGTGNPGLAIFYAGDDAEAKRVAAQLISDAKFAPVDAGSLAEGRYFESGAPLYAQTWSAQEA